MDLQVQAHLLEGLLALHEQPDPASMLPAALTLLLRVVGAARGHVGLEDGEGGPSSTWHATNCPPEEQERVRARVSRGVVAEALASGRVVQTSSALDDARFATLESVKAHKLEAILCAPIVGERVRGFVYVEGRTEPGPFTTPDEQNVERLARVVASRGDVLAHVLERDRSARASSFPGIIAASPAMVALLERAAACAEIDVLVLLTGASGTGKTALARGIHERSPRRAGPFVELNCAAVPESIFESELFGAARGAHSGVGHAALDGKIAAAERGTLFLDEIGELPWGAQAKLLQFLQSRTYHRLGDGAARSADVRIVAATNADLDAEVERRRFREDLLHRLRVVELTLPPLADRLEDVVPLARLLCERVRDRHGSPRLTLSPSALGVLEAASWPGNARQLENVLERGAVAARIAGRTEIAPEDLFPTSGATEPEPRSLEQQLHRHRGMLVRAALQEENWNVKEAALRLDVARSHLYKLIALYGISRPT